MKYKHIEAARELRLWIGQIIVPAATVAITAMTIPEVRQTIAAKANSVKQKKQCRTRTYNLQTEVLRSAN